MKKSYAVFYLAIFFIFSAYDLCEAQISRSQMISNALPYTNFTWTANSCNLNPNWNGQFCGGRNVYSADVAWVNIGTNKSMPYMWGGWSTILQHNTAMSNCKAAGDICSTNGGGCTGGGAGLSCASGHDCSGLVSRAWDLSTKQGTSSLPSLCSVISLSNSQSGDIVNIVGNHTRLIESNYGNGNYQVIEASGRDWRTSYHTYTALQLSSYSTLCPNSNIVIGGCTTSSCTSPSNDDCSSATTITSNGSCLQGSVACATGSYGANNCGNGTSPDDNDVYYKFVAQATSHTVTVSNYASNFDAVIELRKACASGSGNFISCYDPSGVPSSVSNTWDNLTIGQAYYIRVYEYNYTGTPPNSDNFKICVTHSGGSTDCKDDYEDNNSPTPSTSTTVFASPLSSNNSSNYTLQANIGYAGDQDWYKVDIAACGTLTVNLSKLPYNYDMEIYGPNGLSQWINSSENSGTQSEQIIYQSTSSTPTYVYIKVYPQNSNNYTTASCYDLQFKWSPSSCTTTCTTPGMPINVTATATGQNTANLSWVAGSPAGSSPVEYEWVVGTSPSVTFGNGVDQNTTATFPVIARNLICNTQYYLRVRAKTGCNNTYSEYRTSSPFTTSDCPCTLPATPTISANGNTNLCTGGSVQLTTSQTGVSYQWRRNGTNINGANQKSYPVSLIGTYTLVTSNTCGNSGVSNAITVSILSSPATPTISANGSTTICSGSSVSLTTTQTGVSYQWRRNGTNINGATNKSYPVNTAGTYTLITSNSCGNSAVSSSITVSVTSLPTQPGTISGKSTVCAGTKQTYSIPSVVAGVTYEWTYSGGGTPTGSGKSITLTPTSSGNLSVIAKNDCGSSTATVFNITVNPKPSVPGVIVASENPTCNGKAVTYTVPVVTGVTYTWTYSGGGTPTGNSNSISFKPTSNGTLSVVANNDCGAGPSRTLAVTVNNVPEKPVISANGSTTLCNGNSVSLTTTQTGVSYQWFKKGAKITGETKKSLIATVAGTYTLITSNTCGNSAASNSVTVNIAALPTPPGKISGNSTVCAGVKQTYSIPSVIAGVIYEWTYSGGGTPTGSGKSITLTPTSNGKLSVIAKNDCGSSTATVFNITVNPKTSVPGVIVASENPTCNGKAVTYTVPVVTGVTYTWTYSGGGTPTGNSNSISFKPTSNGTLSVVANNDCGAGPARTLVVTVNNVPEKPVISANNSTTFCTGGSVTLSTAQTGVSYQWFKNGAKITGETKKSLIATVAGTYSLLTSNTCGNSIASNMISVVVNTVPSRPSAIQGSPTACKGTNQTYFVDADMSAKDYTWTYTGEGTALGKTRSITFKPTTPGTLSVTANNDCGSSTTRTLKITVKDGAPASQPGIINGETNYCSGEIQKYEIKPVDGATGYLWTYSGGGTPIGDGTSVMLTPTGGGYLRVVALSSCGSSIARSLTITVNPPPNKPIIERIDDVLISSYASNNQWYFNGQPIDNATNKSYILGKKGKYSVEYTNAKGCKSMSEEIDVLSVSIDEKQIGVETFRVYPNPNEGYFNIEIETLKGGDATLDIVNVLGQVVYSEQMKDIKGKRIIQTDLSKNSKGVYFINLYYNNEVINRRIVVQ